MGSILGVEKEYLSQISKKNFLKFYEIFENRKNGIFIQFQEVTSGHSRGPEVGSNEREES